MKRLKLLLKRCAVVFTQKGIEKDPTCKVPPTEVFRTEKPGTCDWRDASLEHRDRFDGILATLQGRVTKRGTLIKPVFQDFDKYVITSNRVQSGCCRSVLLFLDTTMVT